MTSSESTESPRAHTALAKRSTRTVVLPVPAPAETKTSPPASIAACCSGFGARVSTAALMPAPAPAKPAPPLPGRLRRAYGSCPPHAAHRRERAPAGARAAALRIVLHVARADPGHDP